MTIKVKDEVNEVDEYGKKLEHVAKRSTKVVFGNSDHGSTGDDIVGNRLIV